MTDFDWSIAGPFLIVCAAVALLIIPSIAKDVRAARDARRAKATQPEPEPAPTPLPIVACSVYACPDEATERIGPDRWALCDRHAAPYLTKPYDQEAS